MCRLIRRLMAPPLRFRRIPVHNWHGRRIGGRRCSRRHIRHKQIRLLHRAQQWQNQLWKRPKKIAFPVSRLLLYVLLGMPWKKVFVCEESSWYMHAGAYPLAWVLASVSLTLSIKMQLCLFLLTSRTYPKHAFFLVVFNLWTISLRRFRHSFSSKKCLSVAAQSSALSSSGILGMTWRKNGQKIWHKNASVFWLAGLFVSQRRPLDFHLIDQGSADHDFAMNFSANFWALHTSLAWNVPGQIFMNPNCLKFYLEIAIAIWALTRRVWNLPSQSTQNRTLCDWKWDGIMNTALSTSCTPWRFDNF